MDEFFRFIQKSERERNRLSQEARAIYDSVFPRAALSELLRRQNVTEKRVGPPIAPRKVTKGT
jgi:hypothetical protein